MSVSPIPPSGPSVSSILQKSAADGVMSQDEVKELKAALDKASIPEGEKKAILRLADKMQEFSQAGLFTKAGINPEEMAQLKAMEPELADSKFAREMLGLFDQKVQADQPTLLGSIKNFFENLFGGGSAQGADNDSQSCSVTPGLSQGYPPSQMDPQGLSFPNRPCNPAYPDVAPSDPVASLPDYQPDYFKSAPLDISKPGDASRMYQRSPYHDDSKFVPAFAMTSFHESGEYRKPDDPYAVGAITRPTRRQDLGGKTYGTYQFESSVYADGSNAGRNKTAGSTLMRFVNSPNNPFGDKLRAAAQQYGIASPGFDAVWKELAVKENKAFGEAQQQFLLADRTESVNNFMSRAQLSEDVRKDPRIVDLVMGTTNQVASLADGVADYLAQKQASAGRKLTVEEVGVAITDYKKSHIGSWFKSSPGSQAGIRNRYNEEQAVFTA